MGGASARLEGCSGSFLRAGCVLTGFTPTNTISFPTFQGTELCLARVTLSLAERAWNSLGLQRHSARSIRTEYNSELVTSKIPTEASRKVLERGWGGNGGKDKNLQLANRDPQPTPTIT